MDVKKILQVLHSLATKVGFGETLSYGQLAVKAGLSPSSGSNLISHLMIVLSLKGKFNCCIKYKKYKIWLIEFTNSLLKQSLSALISIFN